MHDAISLALKRNLKIQGTSLNEKELNLNLKQSKANFLPTFSIHSNAQVNFGRSLDFTTYTFVNKRTLLSSPNISASVTLFQGFQRLSEIRSNKYILESSKHGSEKIKDEIVLNVISVFLGTQALSDQLRAAQEQNELNLQRLKLETLSFNAGKKRGEDVSSAEYEVKKGDKTIAEISNALNNSHIDLAQLLGFEKRLNPISKSPDSGIPYIRKTAPDSIFDVAINLLPDIKEVRYQKIAAQERIRASKGGLYPRISFSVNLASNISAPLSQGFTGLGKYELPNQLKRNLYEAFAVNITLPISDKLQVRYNIERAKLAYESAVINEKNVRYNVFKIINKAHGDLMTAEKVYDLSKQVHDSAKKTYSLMQIRYQAGMVNFLEVSQAQTMVNNAEFELINAKYDLIFKSKIIDYYLGSPISY